MFGKYFLAFCAFALFAAVVSSNAAQIPPKVVQDLKKSDFELADIIEDIIEYLSKFIFDATKNCLTEIATHCKDYWTDPIALVECGVNYFFESLGACAISKKANK